MGGNNGKNNNTPTVGDRFDLGIGANVIGGVKLGDNVIVGANALVNKNFESNIIIAGIPAQVIKENHKED